MAFAKASGCDVRYERIPFHPSALVFHPARGGTSGCALSMVRLPPLAQGTARIRESERIEPPILLRRAVPFVVIHTPETPAIFRSPASAARSPVRSSGSIGQAGQNRFMLKY